jgi:uncharacterized phage-associated protein
MNIPSAKLKAIILYFGTNTNGKFLVKVKLMKLFYFLDFLHVKKYGLPVTFDDYVHLEHGPIPSSIKNLVDTACDDIDNSMLADIVSFETPEGTQMKRIVLSRKFKTKDEGFFSFTEMEILKEVCQRFGEVNTQTIEDASHQEAPWKLTDILERIPYTLAAQDKDCLVSEEEIELAIRLSA